MEIRHLRPCNYKTSAWSGGTTTELLLYPADGSYAERRFRVRISSATVALEQSDFTPLAGVTRYITPLSGGFTLTHPSGESVRLAPLAPPYRFSGETPTHCVGRATDFNLMLKGCEGEMTVFCDRRDILAGLNAFYPTRDAVLCVDGQSFSLKSGELLVVFTQAPSEVTATAPTLHCWASIA